MKNESLKFSSVLDQELLDQAINYLFMLRRRLPTQRLKDCSAGASALLFELSEFLRIHPERHGNY